MEKQDIILIGGGGHCKSCIDVIETENSYNIIGVLDVEEKIGNDILGYKIIGSDKDIEKLSEKYDNFFVTLGQIKSVNQRINLFNKLKGLGKKIPTIISPKAYVSKHSNIGEGTIVMHQALINSGCVIGSNCIINTKSLIEHDTIIGNNCHISTASIVNGNVKIGDSCMIGSNAIIKHGVCIAGETIIGAGSLVISTIKDKGIYAGSPSKKI